MGRKSKKQQATVKNVTNPSVTPKKTADKSSPQRRELDKLSEDLLKLSFKQTNAINEQWQEYRQIHGFLEQIREIEQKLISSCKVEKSRVTAIDSFCEWCQRNGAHFDGIEIGEFAGFDLGLQAGRNFKEGDLMITVPSNMIMSEESLTKTLDAICREIPLVDSMPNVKLAFGLVLEKLNPNSFWKPYLDLLPQEYSTVMYFTPELMEELKGSNVFTQALNQCKNIARQYAFVSKCIKSMNLEALGANPQAKEIFGKLKEQFTYELYRWAVSTVMTRQNAIPRTKCDDTESPHNMMPALIPLWDLSNHREGKFTSSYNIDLGRLESSALYNYIKGEQIFIYYGERSNGDFLVHNGFVYPENVNDNITIRLGLSSSDPLAEGRAVLLKILNIERCCELKVIRSPNYISAELLAFVRIFNMSEEQLNHWQKSGRATDLLYMDCALETSLESKSWLFLQMRFTILLKAFATSLEDDEKLLAEHMNGVDEDRMSASKAMIVQYRILEKRILKNAIEYAKQRIKA